MLSPDQRHILIDDLTDDVVPPSVFTNKGEFDPRKYLGDSVKAMKKIVIERYEAFGTAGQASKIRPISLESMFSAYAKGSLDPLVN